MLPGRILWSLRCGSWDHYRRESRDGEWLDGLEVESMKWAVFWQEFEFKCFALDHQYTESLDEMSMNFLAIRLHAVNQSKQTMLAWPVPSR